MLCALFTGVSIGEKKIAIYISFRKLYFLFIILNNLFIFVKFFVWIKDFLWKILKGTKSGSTHFNVKGLLPVNTVQWPFFLSDYKINIEGSYRLHLKETAIHLIFPTLTPPIKVPRTNNAAIINEQEQSTFEIVMPIVTIENIPNSLVLKDNDDLLLVTPLFFGIDPTFQTKVSSIFKLIENVVHIILIDL